MSSLSLTYYKGYTIRVTGLSHHIYRPGQDIKEYAPGYAQSLAGARRWINTDLADLARRSPLNTSSPGQNSSRG